MIVKYVVCVLFLIAALVTDIKGYKIKNIAILPTIFVGFIIAFIMHSPLDSLLGMLAPLVLFPFYALRMLGAGDIKALCALGAVVGLRMSVETLIFTFLSGGIIAIVFMLFSGNAVERFKYFFNYLKLCLLARKPQSYDFGDGEKSCFRFAYAIFAGFVCAVINSYVHVI